MKMIVEGPSLIRVGGKLPFLVLRNQRSEADVALNFVIFVEDSDTGGMSLVAARM